MTEDDKSLIWDKLGASINDAANLAILLVSAAEEHVFPNAELAKEQHDALLYGIYKLHAMLREIRAMFLVASRVH